MSVHIAAELNRDGVENIGRVILSLRDPALHGVGDEVAMLLGASNWVRKRLRLCWAGGVIVSVLTIVVVSVRPMTPWAELLR
eukprot:CAMPEP_0206508686 /NCGR_PEP_ID=MMETSP0324_2-20121206/58488_1 /ASSEMBLY_ACC=CAM_ASM_000836 /TAXON_ID=2866 /ORGANISM="Crypthecodinium cohnii, Strain Seligo" /LENGTH=81 /DNA_ID=CAMNT_0053999613 /DNA_START=522 /DNA_END=768 /DNA_ORIENTATION=-